MYVGTILLFKSGLFNVMFAANLYINGINEVSLQC